MATKKKLLITILTIMVLISASGMTGFHSALNLVRPDVRVTRVVHDSSVQFRAENFPGDVFVEVLIGAHGTHGVNGVKVGTFTTSHSGSIRTTVNIPSRFRGDSRLDLRVQRKGYNGTNRTDLYADVAFSNASTGGTNQTYNIVRIQVISVDADNSVTVRLNNLPPNLLFEVRMSALDASLRRSRVTGSFNSGAGGSMTVTFNIPAEFIGEELIFLAVYNPSQGYFGMAMVRNR